MKLDEKFGRYELTIVKTDDEFHVSRKLALLPLRVPAEEYEDLRKFLAEVSRADKTTLTFHHAEGHS